MSDNKETIKTNTKTIKLTTPVMLDGEQRSELILRELTPADIEKYGTPHKILISDTGDKFVKLDYAVAARIAEACCGLTEGELMKLSSKDYLAVCGVIISFLG